MAFAAIVISRGQAQTHKRFLAWLLVLFLVVMALTAAAHAAQQLHHGHDYEECLVCIELFKLSKAAGRQALTLLMAILKTPKLLLLDEHTAALDPKTARKVLELSNHFISSMNLTCMMVTHNMRDAIAAGNRLIMMSQGRIILDVNGEEKKMLTVEQLIRLFSSRSGEEIINDRMVLG